MKKYTAPFDIILRGSVLLLGVGFIVLSGCKNDITPSLYDNTVHGSPAPLISAISLTGNGLAGVSTFTITGSNFSAIKDENTVYFDAVAGTIVSNTATQITVTAAALVKDSIRLRVKVTGALAFSNPFFINLKAAVNEFGALTNTEEATGIACDTAGKLYVSIIKNFNGDGIRKYSEDESYSQFCTANGVTYWSAMKIGPGGVLYAVRNVRAMYTIAQNGAPVPWVQISGASFFDLDFDKFGNVWTGGNGTFLYRIKFSDKSVKSIPFEANIKSIRVFNDYVYAAAKVDSTEGIYRFKIYSADSIGSAEKYFELSGKPGYIYNGLGATAVTFNSEGEMYVGTNSPDGVLIVHPDLTYEKYYSGLFKPDAINFAWGKGSTLYISRGGSAASHVIIKVNTQKTSAPYYGRGDL